MKLALLSLTCILIALVTNAQRISLSGVVDITLPSGAEKLSQSKVNELTYGNSAYAQLRKRDVNKADFYLVNNTILRIEGDTVNEPVSVEEFKKKLDHLMLNNAAQRANYVSEIKTKNNFKVLVHHFQGGLYSYFGYYAVNNTNSKVLKGYLEYDKKDGKDAAEMTLNEFLDHVRFK